MPAAKKTTDHREIQRWVESHGGHPATVKRTRGKNDVGLIRIDFPGFSGEGSLEAIGWDEWFSKFDEQGLALLYQEGKNTNFNKLVRRDPNEVRPSDVKSGRARTARGGRLGRAAGARGRRNASQSRSSSNTKNQKSASGSSRSSASAGGSRGRSTARRSTASTGRSSTRSASSNTSSRSNSSSASRRGAATRSASSNRTSGSNASTRSSARTSAASSRGSASSRTAASKRARAATQRKRAPSRTSGRNGSRQMQDLTRAELYEQARSANIPNRSHMSKDQLLRALERQA